MTCTKNSCHTDFNLSDNFSVQKSVWHFWFKVKYDDLPLFFSMLALLTIRRNFSPDKYLNNKKDVKSAIVSQTFIYFSDLMAKNWCQSLFLAFFCHSFYFCWRIQFNLEQSVGMSRMWHRNSTSLQHDVWRFASSAYIYTARDVP